jgi:hypothetical protein
VSIRNGGWNPQLARGKLQVVWLMTASRLSWGLRHLSARHGITADRLVWLKVQVRRDLIHRKRKGIWVSSLPIPPDHTVSLRPAAYITTPW